MNRRSIIILIAAMAGLTLSSCSRTRQWTVPADMPVNPFRSEWAFKRALNLTAPNLQEICFKAVDDVYFGFYTDPHSGNYLVVVASNMPEGGGNAISIVDRKTHQDVGRFIKSHQITFENHKETYGYNWPDILLLRTTTIMSSYSTSSFLAGAWYAMSEPENQIHLHARFNRQKVAGAPKGEAYFFEAEFDGRAHAWTVASRYQPSWP